jgi:outer membrane protein TolC
MKRSILNFLIATSLTAGAQPLTVDHVVQLALQKNYDIRLFQNSAALAINDSRYSFGVFLPNLNAQGGYTRNIIDARTQLFNDSIINRPGANFSNINSSLQMVWTVFDGTRMFATRKRLRELEALGALNARNQMINSTATVIATYYGIVRQKQQLKAIQEQTSVSEERVKLAERKLQVGTGGKPELLQAKVDLNAFKTAALQQVTLIQQLKDQLNSLLGMGLPDTFEVSDTIPITLDITLPMILENVENMNTALLAARKSIQVAEQSVRESRAGRSPIINFNAALTYNRREDELQANPFSTKSSRNQGYNYGLSVTLPIMNGMNVNRLIGQSKINLERQRITYDQQLTLVTTGIRIAFTSYENAIKVLQIEEENILLARENVSIALEGFRRGITTFIELRTAQQSLADAYNRLIAARFNAKISETELLRLQGTLIQ